MASKPNRNRNQLFIHARTVAISREQNDYIKQRSAELKMTPPEFMRQIIDNSMAMNPTVKEAENRRQEQLEENDGWVAHIPA